MDNMTTKHSGEGESDFAFGNEKETLDNFDKSWQLELKDKSANIEDENMAPSNTQRAKKKPGKQPKNSKVLKEKSSKSDVATKTNDATVKITVETNADTAVIAPKGKGKKGGKMEAIKDSHVVEVVDPLTEPGRKEIPEETSDHPKKAEAKGKKGQGKKAQPAAKVEETIDVPQDNPDPIVADLQQETEAVSDSKPQAKGRGKKVKVPVKEVPVVSAHEEIVPAEVVAEVPEPKKKGRGKKIDIGTDGPVVEATQHQAIKESTAVVKKPRGKATKAAKSAAGKAEGVLSVETEVCQPEAPVAEIKIGGRGKQKVAVEKAEEKHEAELKELEGRGIQIQAAKSNEGPLPNVADTEPAKVPVAKTSPGRIFKRGIGKKATVVELADDPEDVFNFVDEDPEFPKKQKGSKRGKAAKNDVNSPPKKMKEDTVESEASREPSTNQAQSVKSSVETKKKEPQKKRVTKKAQTKNVAQEEVQIQDEMTVEVVDPEIQPPKDIAIDCNAQRCNSGDEKEVELQVPEKKKGRGAKKVVLPVQKADEPEEESEASPSKKSKQHESDNVPEKKAKGRKKKGDPAAAADTEKDLPGQATKKVEVEKKKRAGRKDKEEPESELPVEPKQRGKRAVQSHKDAVVSSSNNPSPAGPSAPKGRRLKLVEPITVGPEDEGDVPAVIAPKRTYPRN